MASMKHIASASTPPDPFEAASKPKLVPESMAHWTAALITERGERVPRHLVAYAVGAAFPREHLRPVAEAICSREMLGDYGDNYLAAFLFHLIDIGAKHVSPGLPGQKPPHRPISDESWAGFLGWLQAKGVSDEVRESMRMCCVQWRKGAAYPVWVPQQLLDTIREQEQERRERQRAKRRAKEKASEEAAATTMGHIAAASA
ncbi:hypothetical protein C8T65DRAFT_825643 [Cerioporus squamosus]|nr:hypothetical protein C8T65DRAFT_825643 [Cerioporus squamosus]